MKATPKKGNAPGKRSPSALERGRWHVDGVSSALQSKFVGSLLVLALFAPATSLAQSPNEDVEATESEASNEPDEQYAEPTEEQLELNDRAVRALSEGDMVTAVNLLEESNQIGPLNVTYLNLGRAYQQLDDCERARSAFEAVAEAPRLAKPSPELVERKAGEYIDEWEETCGEPPADAVPEDSSVAGVDDRPVEGASTNRSRLGWALVIGGGAALGAGVGLHLGARHQRDQVRDATVNAEGQVVSISQVQAREALDRANTLDTVALSSAIVGAVALSAGGYFLLSEPSNSEFAVSAGPNGTTFIFRTTF